MPEARIFALGQRWISDTEPELGLGIVTDLDHRTVTVAFRSCQQTRRYAQAQAPLTRLRLASGDPVSLPGSGDEPPLDAVIEARHEGSHHTFVYMVSVNDGPPQPLPEQALPDALSMNRPLDRLLAGQYESATWFELRRRTSDLLQRAQSSGLMGLCSARADLIPHQYYIASEVANRYAPRVMLADEVGLGKTIEAGLILQQQLTLGLASRVLIVVPEPLLHQWLVEMLRRFNLLFTIIDEPRYQALIESGEDNPFATSQLVLCPLSLFLNSPAHLASARSVEWDLCIVDEAHHLQLQLESSPAQALPDTEAYQALASLAATTKGLLLLSATPEQMGQSNFFALLRLIDPARFNDFEQFQAEQHRYQEIAERIEKIRNTSPVDSDEIRRLLDQHGTGRILFRNTRRALGNMPERELHAWPLPASAESSQPRTGKSANSDADPRLAWLRQWLDDHRSKTLLICSDDATVMTLEEQLRLAGVRCSVFHRGMSLLERDRAAAYFSSDEPDAARILICSEIGSEGRNFQFCRNLILYDLPGSPDVLEQRIGRLDRIGQTHTIQIHVPYQRNTSQELLFNWYHRALNAFCQIAPGAWQTWAVFREQLQRCIHLADSGQDVQTAEFEGFLDAARAHHEGVCQSLEHGRDQLLDMNSFDAAAAQTIISAIQQFEANSSLDSWLIDVLDHYGVFNERHSDGSITIVPSEDMLIPAFPGLPDAGIDACFDRQLALVRDDLAHLTWQHPMVIGALDLVLATTHGNACISTSSSDRTTNPNQPRTGEFVLQLLYRIRVDAPAQLQLQKYLTDRAINVTLTLNEEGEPVTLTSAYPGSTQQAVERSAATQFLEENRQSLLDLLQTGNQLASEQCKQLTSQTSKTMLEAQMQEIKRLLALKQRNPNIRDEEIQFLKDQTLALHNCLSGAKAELTALHLVIMN